MMNFSSGPQIPGSDKVREWFGYWPDFHDAEIVSLHLCRSGDSVLRVYPYAPEKPATVEFFLSEMVGLELWDFSSQNVIGSLDIEWAKREDSDTVVRLRMHPCYGLAGYLEAKEIRVSVMPGKSSDGISLW